MDETVIHNFTPGFPRFWESGKKSGILKCHISGRGSREKVGNSILSKFNTSQLLHQNSGTTQRTEMADHFLESLPQQKYKNVGFILLGWRKTGET